MKHLLPVVLLVALCLKASADALRPPDVVREAILAAQANKLNEFLHLVDVGAIQSHREDAMSAQQAVSFLKKLDAKALTFSNPEGELGLKMGTKFDLILTGPVRIKFVMLCTGFPDGSPAFKIWAMKKLQSKPA